MLLDLFNKYSNKYNIYIGEKISAHNVNSFASSDYLSQFLLYPCNNGKKKELKRIQNDAIRTCSLVLKSSES